MQRIKSFILAHKVWSVLILVFLIGVGRWAYGKATSTAGVIRSVLAQVEKGTITASISGSGSVSTTQDVEIQPKVSGDVVSVSVKEGQEVKAGAVIAQLNTRDAARAVRDAELNLETAVLSLQKLKAPPEKLTLLQAENALAQAERDLADIKKPPEAGTLLQAQNALTTAEQTKRNTETALQEDYFKGFDTVTDVFLELPTIMSGLEDMFYGNTIQAYVDNIDWYANQVRNDPTNKLALYKSALTNSYEKARDSYDATFTHYKALNRNSAVSELESITNESYATITLVTEAIKNAKNYVDFVRDNLEENRAPVPSTITATQNTLNTYTSQTTAHASSLQAITSTITNDKQSIESSARTVAEKQEALSTVTKGSDESDIQRLEETVNERRESLKKLQEGPDTLDLRAQELTVEQRRNSLSDAREKLSDYTVRAPFDGLVASVDVQRGDTASSSTALATLIAHQRVAEISLNEVDVAKVALGQKSMLTFDAVPDLTISGEVAEIDAIGTTSQGVVSYMVKITFDTQDERIKPGMSVIASIITAAKVDVLMVPNAAVKSQGSGSYVEVVSAPDKPLYATQGVGVNAGVELSTPTERKPVEVGIQNDESTEITSGLVEGDVVVTNTLTASATATTSSSGATGGLRLPFTSGGGGSAGPGNAVRTLR